VTAGKPTPTKADGFAQDGGGDQNVNETRSPVSSLLGPTPPNALSIGSPVALGLLSERYKTSIGRLKTFDHPIAFCALKTPAKRGLRVRQHLEQRDPEKERSELVWFFLVQGSRVILERTDPCISVL